MIGCLQVQVQAHNPNMPLCPCFSFKGSPSSLRIQGVPKQIGEWRITEVYATLHYPDDVEKTKLAVREGNIYVATLDGCQTTGKVVNGVSITANGIDEDGNETTGYVLGRGDLYVMEGDSIVPDPSVVKNYMKLCDELPSAPTKGDAYFQNGALVVYDGTEWKPACDISELESEVPKKRDKTDMVVYEQTYAPFTMTIEGQQESYTLTWDADEAGGIWHDEFNMSAVRYNSELSAWQLGTKMLIWNWGSDTEAPIDALQIDFDNGTAVHMTRSAVYDINPTQDTLATNSSLSEKQDKLTVAQGLALDSVVGERETKVLFSDGTTSSYYIVGTLLQQQVQSWNKSPVEVVVGNAVTRIGNSAFRDISSLATVTIPDGVTSIGDGAFKGCSGLTGVTIPNSVTSIGDGAFRECSSLTSVMIGNGVTSIGNSSFRDCTSLSSVSTPNTISAIGAYAFYHTAITSFNFPKNLQNIGTGAFTRVPLTALEFNDGLLSIDSYCFRQCSSLTDIEIPESVETLGYAAFMETTISSAVFKGRTMEQVSAMQNYPWGIPISAISTENNATKEWVEGQDYATETYAVQNDGGVGKIKSLTELQYENLTDKDPTTLYVIPEEV